MVFIRKRLVEDDFTDSSAAELVDAGIDKIASQDSSAQIPTTEAEIEEKLYNWHEILTILSDYVNSQALEQIEDDWMKNYPNNTMGQEDVDDLLSDIAVSFNEEIASEIEARINQLQTSNSTLNNSSTKEFEKLLNNTVEQYNNGSLSKLEYIGQVGTLVKDFIKDLANVPEDKREELFNKAEELINNIVK